MNVKYSCEKHINYALDLFMEETKEFPILERLTEEEKVSTKCFHCDEQAEYVVSRK